MTEKDIDIVFADIELADSCADDGWRSFITILSDGKRVHFRHDFIEPGSPRGTEYDAGAGFEIERLNEVIEALQAIKKAYIKE